MSSIKAQCLCNFMALILSTWFYRVILLGKGDYGMSFLSLSLEREKTREKTVHFFPMQLKLKMMSTQLRHSKLVLDLVAVNIS